MKMMKYAAMTTVLSALSFGAFAAQSVSPANTQGLDKIGVVTASGAMTLDGLEAELAAKAQAAGATRYAIISANTNNKISGTAIIYK